MSDVVYLGYDTSDWLLPGVETGGERASWVFSTPLEENRTKNNNISKKHLPNHVHYICAELNY